MTERIRWNDGNDIEGHAGAIGPFAFRIQRMYAGERWLLTAELLSMGFKHDRADNLEALKATAERWLSEFVSSLGASFPAEPAKPQKSRAWHADWAVVDRDQDGNEEKGIVRLVRCDTIREAITRELSGTRQTQPGEETGDGRS